MSISLSVAQPLAAAASNPATAYKNNQVNPVVPLPTGLTDNFESNRQFEPTIARDPTNGKFLAGAIDLRDKPNCAATGTSGNLTTGNCNQGLTAGVSGVYYSTDGATWHQFAYNDSCAGTIHTLPGYCASSPSLFSGFDPEIVFGPRPVAGGGFSFANGARAYYVDLAQLTQYPLRDSAVVAVSRSDSDGNLWKSPVVASSTNNHSTQTNDKDAIWADSTATTPGGAANPCFGNVYTAWDLFAGPSLSNPTSDNIEFSRSINGGSTYSTALPLTSYTNNAKGGPQGAVIRSLPDGTVVVVWQDFLQGGPVIAYSESRDCGQTFTAPAVVAHLVVLSGGALPGASFPVFSFPAMDVDSLGNVFVAWSTVENGAPVIRLTRSTDGGTTWTAPALISDPAAGSGIEPAVGAAASGGKVVVSYINYWSTSRTPGAGHARYDTRVAISNDSGQSFTRHQLAGRVGDPDGVFQVSLARQFIGDYTSIIVTTVNSVPTAFPIWTDARNAPPCADVDAYAAGLAAGQSPPPPDPDVNSQCPAGFGNSDIYTAAVPLP